MTELRDRARRLFATACAAADPAAALRASLHDIPLPPPDPGGRIVVVAFGKAAVPMAEELTRHLEGIPADSIVVTNYENARALEGAIVMPAGHPVPDENGARAAQEVIARLRNARAVDRVVALVSGGGSALLPAPAEGLTLEDKAATNRLLLANGCDITEMNLIRQQLSQLKGGGMARLADPAPVSAYILSDVIGDDLRVIASGPTVAPIGTRADACNVLRARGLWEALPGRVREHLANEGAACAVPPARNILIGSNRKSLDAVAAAAGAGARIVSDRLIGDVADAAAVVVNAAQNAAPHARAVLIFGGETTVNLRGDGLGGRNQELALRVALSMPDLGRDWVFLSGGTDGRDGPTEAAGGIVDSGTRARLVTSGHDPEALLANNDSNAALAAAGDLLVTGATGTNVADVQLLLLGAVRNG